MSFDFTKFKIPGLFSRQNEKTEQTPETEPDEKISYQRFGFIQAGTMKGKTEGLKICLNTVYEQHMARMREDEARQEELRKPYRTKAAELAAANESMKTRIMTLQQETIPSRKAKVGEFRKEITEIRKNPDEYAGAYVGKVGFYIGLLILVLLSVYLFIFYSSASYSAFFKEFVPDDAVITKAIFDANAIGNSLKDGLTELIFILTIPFVFIGLGYLIHKFQESKGRSKYFKIAALLILTFIFDSIIAYEITEKIYNIKSVNDISGDMPVYSFQLAFANVGFWLVIFAGFVVYLIWGFVFDFVMAAHARLDMVKVHINAKRDQIAEVEKDIAALESKVEELNLEVGNNNAEVSRLKHIIEGTIILPKEVREALSTFMVGWHNWLSQGREYDRSAHNTIYEAFLATRVDNIESFINAN